MANGFSAAGDILQGAAAGLRGRGAEFTQNLRDERRRREEERMRTVFTDSAQALSLAQQGRWDLVQQIGESRLRGAGQFPGTDFRDTERLTRMAAQAAQGDLSAQDNLLQTLQSNVQTGRQLGILGQGTTAGARDFERLTAGLSEEDRERARRIQLGLDPRASAVTAERERALALARGEGKGEAGRTGVAIDEGLNAARGIPVLRRSLQLMERIETGGIDAAAHRAARLFGVEGADEGELSANLGRAVLSQLRGIFGAQFTEKEGARLERIEAGFGKSTATNKRLLRQALTLANSAADRGLDAAKSANDTRSRDEILDFMEGRFDLTDEALQEVFNPQGATQAEQFPIGAAVPQAPQAPQVTQPQQTGGIRFLGFE